MHALIANADSTVGEITIIQNIQKYMRMEVLRAHFQ
jgi:hypothetical protein